jgi:N6-adenosine-specific RNA methylase IME4
LLETIAPAFHFGCCAADPAWSFNDKGSRIAPDEGQGQFGVDGREDVRHYHTMSVQEICDLPVRLVMAQQSHLYLWCPATLLLTHVPPVLAAWDFTYKTLLAWRKVTKTGKVHFGAGHYFRGGVEYCVFATRGGCKALVHTERAIFDGPVGRHSAKP